MPNVRITGHLMKAKIIDDDSDTEARIHVFADLSKQKVEYIIDVPMGMMDLVMPIHWNSPVTVTAEDGPGQAAYRLIDIAEPSSEAQPGLQYE